MPHDALQVAVRRRLQVAADDTAQGVAREPNAGALEEFLVLVPAADCVRGELPS